MHKEELKAQTSQKNLSTVKEGTQKALLMHQSYVNRNTSRKNTATEKTVPAFKRQLEELKTSYQSPYKQMKTQRAASGKKIVNLTIDKTKSRTAAGRPRSSYMSLTASRSMAIKVGKNEASSADKRIDVVTPPNKFNRIKNGTGLEDIDEVLRPESSQKVKGIKHSFKKRAQMRKDPWMVREHPIDPRPMLKSEPLK